MAKDSQVLKSVPYYRLHTRNSNWASVDQLGQYSVIRDQTSVVENFKVLDQLWLGELKLSLGKTRRYQRSGSLEVHPRSVGACL